LHTFRQLNKYGKSQDSQFKQSDTFLLTSNLTTDSV